MNPFFILTLVKSVLLTTVLKFLAVTDGCPANNLLACLLTIS